MTLQSVALPIPPECWPGLAKDFSRQVIHFLKHYSLVNLVWMGGCACLSIWVFWLLVSWWLPPPNKKNQSPIPITHEFLQTSPWKGMCHITTSRDKKNYRVVFCQSHFKLVAQQCSTCVQAQAISAATHFLSFSGWWFQPIWKIWSSNVVHRPPIFGVKIPKNVWVATT